MLFRDAIDPDVADQMQRVQEQATALIARADGRRARRGARDDAARRCSVEMLAQQLSGAMQALANWWFDHQDVPRARLVEAAVEFAWEGLERARERRVSPSR